MAIVYFDGEFVDESAARIPLSTHALNYGTAAFEGLRSYAEGARSFVFRPREHYERLLRNAEMLEMKVSQTAAEFTELTSELLRRNRCREDRYIRPLIYKNSTRIGAGLPAGETVAILTQEMPRGPIPRPPARATWSKWRRTPAAACPAGAKITGLYVNSSMARADAIARGYDQPIMLTMEGKVAEGYGANLFAVFGNHVVTPALEADILPGITRDALLRDFRSHPGLTVSEAMIAPERLLEADEVFLCGTGMEILPIASIEGHPVGSGVCGPLTSKAINWYRELITGKSAHHHDWIVAVDCA
jgi:branched-chain amino acid aminotransferase